MSCCSLGLRASGWFCRGKLPLPNHSGYVHMQQVCCGNSCHINRCRPPQWGYFWRMCLDFCKPVQMKRMDTETSATKLPGHIV
ncbi:hypothetical protein GDO78_002270 [Eleutherodactylus coqui]|uniref:Uncharacterized protein n=1 Tax=Eleutherodactylus coqui TaxID=57060 RepID=A0A8J6EY35_ELECQ|nr:hypothetical protein GDO78_002270 [Eleutherodactylus coqui]